MREIPTFICVRRVKQWRFVSIAALGSSIADANPDNGIVCPQADGVTRRHRGCSFLSGVIGRVSVDCWGFQQRFSIYFIAAEASRREFKAPSGCIF